MITVLLVYGKDFDSSKEARPQQGGRFASAGDNIKNKANTARLQGDKTFQVIASNGDLLEYNSAEYQAYQEQQRQQQAQQQRQQEIQRQQDIQRNNRRETQPNLYPGLSSYEGIPQTQTTAYQVTTPDGKIRTFNSEAKANKFAKNYGTGATVSETSKYQVETPDGKIRTFNSEQHADRFAKNYGIHEPLKLGVSIFDKPQGQIEKFFEGSSRYFVNLASQAKDFSEAIRTNTLQSPKAFTEPNNPFGLPVPKYNTPLKPTTSNELFQGKIPDLSDPGMLGSAVTEVGLLALGLKSGGMIGKVGNKLTVTKNQRLVEKSLKPLESPKVLTTEKIQKFGPSFPNTGEFLKGIYQKTKFQNVDILKQGGIKITPLKGTTDYFKIESQNPLQDKLVFAQVKKGDVKIQTFEPESIMPPKGVRIRTNSKDELNVELSKFNLEKKEIGVYQTKQKSDISNIQKAMGTDSIKPVARTRGYSLEQVLQDPKKFSRYLFQETTIGKPPVKPLFDLSLAETRSFGTVGSKINTYPKTEFDIPLRGQQYDIPKVFQAFKESKVRVGESVVKGRNIRITKPNYFKKKSILDTFVYDVQKNIKMVDPFSTSRLFKSKPAKSFSKGEFKITDEEPFGKNLGQTFVKSPQEFKNSIEKQIQKEIKSKTQASVTFPKYTGFVYGTQQETIAYPKTEKVDNEFSFFFKKQPSVRSIQRNPLNEFTILKETTKGRSDFGFVPIQLPKIQDMIKQSTKTQQPQALIPKIISDQIPRQTTKTTPITTTKTTTKTTPITTPIPIPIIPNREIPIVPQKFGFPPYFPSAFFGSGGYENPASLKKAFAAYGISSDINIKTLPTYSRYSVGSGIFKEQAKEDTRIQNLFYGKPRRKSKTTKKSNSKKKSRKR